LGRFVHSSRQKLRWWLDDGGVGKAADLAIKAFGVVAALIAINLFARAPTLSSELKCATPIDQLTFTNAYNGGAIPPVVTETIEQDNENADQLVGFTPSVGASTLRLACSNSLNVAEGLPGDTPDRDAKLAVLKEAYPDSLTSFDEGTMLVPPEVLTIAASDVTASALRQAVAAIERARLIHFQVTVKNNGPGTASGVSVDHPPNFFPGGARSRVELGRGETEPMTFETTSGDTTLRSSTVAFPVDFESSKSIDTNKWRTVLEVVLLLVGVVTVTQIAIAQAPKKKDA
jgi:hypothetical protein